MIELGLSLGYSRKLSILADLQTVDAQEMLHLKTSTGDYSFHIITLLITAAIYIPKLTSSYLATNYDLLTKRKIQD